MRAAMGLPSVSAVVSAFKVPAHLRDFKGWRAVVDAMPLLYKMCLADPLAAVGLPREARHLPMTAPMLQYLEAQINILLREGLDVTLVFYGDLWPLKLAERERRLGVSRAAVDAAAQALAEQRHDNALKYAKKGCRPSMDLVDWVIDWALTRARNVQVIVAPFEADAQLALLAEQRDTVVVSPASDSDLTFCYAIPVVLSDVQHDGWCKMTCMANVRAADAAGVVIGGKCYNLAGWPTIHCRVWASATGCDYFEKIPNFGRAHLYDIVKECVAEKRTARETVAVIAERARLDGRRVGALVAAARSFMHHIVFHEVEVLSSSGTVVGTRLELGPLHPWDFEWPHWGDSASESTFAVENMLLRLPPRNYWRLIHSGEVRAVPNDRHQYVQRHKLPSDFSSTMSTGVFVDLCRVPVQERAQRMNAMTIQDLKRFCVERGVHLSSEIKLKAHFVQVVSEMLHIMDSDPNSFQVIHVVHPDLEGWNRADQVQVVAGVLLVKDNAHAFITKGIVPAPVRAALGSVPARPIVTEQVVKTFCPDTFANTYDRGMQLVLCKHCHVSGLQVRFGRLRGSQSCVVCVFRMTVNPSMRNDRVHTVVVAMFCDPAGPARVLHQPSTYCTCEFEGILCAHKIALLLVIKKIQEGTQWSTWADSLAHIPHFTSAAAVTAEVRLWSKAFRHPMQARDCKIVHASAKTRTKADKALSAVERMEHAFSHPVIIDVEPTNLRAQLHHTPDADAAAKPLWVPGTPEHAQVVQRLLASGHFRGTLLEMVGGRLLAVQGLHCGLPAQASSSAGSAETGPAQPPHQATVSCMPVTTGASACTCAQIPQAHGEARVPPACVHTLTPLSCACQPVSGSAGTLTHEQRSLMERNRQQALALRQASAASRLSVRAGPVPYVALSSVRMPSEGSSVCWSEAPQATPATTGAYASTLAQVPQAQGHGPVPPASSHTFVPCSSDCHSVGVSGSALTHEQRSLIGRNRQQALALRQASAASSLSVQRGPVHRQDVASGTAIAHWSEAPQAPAASPSRRPKRAEPGVSPMRSPTQMAAAIVGVFSGIASKVGRLLTPGGGADSSVHARTRPQRFDLAAEAGETRTRLLQHFDDAEAPATAV